MHKPREVIVKVEWDGRPMHMAKIFERGKTSYYKQALSDEQRWTHGKQNRVVFWLADKIHDGHYALRYVVPDQKGWT